ncbi:metallophosphoesterase family protein [Sulfurospirillum arcachonense]|uniref:metallophosphoesterase family protein n=1 Tax=Sulfurospirillum arcachonense TaxID=57666 RepID=UPI0004B35B9F|nr:metallophosphoesterase family protein [Sulfurospirillum arcachonense]
MKDIKIAILSDIHGNIFALEEVYKNAKSKGVDKFINLGDIFYGPIEPKKTYDFLKEHDFITISGNQDRFLLEVDKQAISQNPTIKFVLDELGSEGLEWIKKLDFDLHVDKDIYICHGTPSNDEEYLLETFDKTIKEDKEIKNSLKDIDKSVILCGHSHKPRLIKLSSGQIVINPGSVGLPAYNDDVPVKHTMQNYYPHASYAILEKSKFGWNVDFVKVAYDVKSAVESTKKRDRDDWVYYLKHGKGLVL